MMTCGPALSPSTDQANISAPSPLARYDVSSETSTASAASIVSSPPIAFQSVVSCSSCDELPPAGSDDGMPCAVIHCRPMVIAFDEGPSSSRIHIEYACP